MAIVDLSAMSRISSSIAAISFSIIPTRDGSSVPHPCRSDGSPTSMRPSRWVTATNALSLRRYVVAERHGHLSNHCHGRDRWRHPSGSRPLLPRLLWLLERSRYLGLMLQGGTDESITGVYWTSKSSLASPSPSSSSASSSSATLCGCV